MSIENEIREFVVENFLFGVDSGITNDSSFLKEGIIDSTGILQLVSHIQEQYLISVEDEELIPENLDSIGRVATFIQKKLAVAQSAAGMADPAPADAG